MKKEEIVSNNSQNQALENAIKKQRKTLEKRAKNKVFENENTLVSTLESMTKDCDLHPLAPFFTQLFNAVCQRAGRQIVIVCFGTSTISGDSLGPMVGTLLCQKYNVPAFVYGTNEAQINGKNMVDWIEFINRVHEGALFISVDASLGHDDKVGQIVFREDGVCPAGVTGKKARFGDIGVLGVVAKKKGDPIMQLLSVSPVYVEKLADKISNMLNQVIAS